MKKSIVTLLALTLLLLGCARNMPSSSKETPAQSSQQESTPSESNEAEELRLKANEYYDYFAKTSHVSMLMQDELTEPGFSDVEMSSFVLCELIARSHDVGVPETEFAQDLFQETAEKFFGKKIVKLENRMTTVMPNGMVTSTGWGGSMTRLVLQSLETLPDGSKRAEFLQYGFGIGEGLPSAEQLKAELLAGKNDGYAAHPIPIRIIFEEKYDEQGALYFLYKDIEFPD